MCAISPSVRAGKCRSCAASPTPTIATSAGGAALVRRGSTNTIAMVSATSPAMSARADPCIHCGPCGPGTLKCSNCARAMMIARPFTKPSITGWGTMRISLPSRNAPNSIMTMPLSTTVANRYCGPCWTTSATITTAIDPAAPEIMPGRPPNRAVIVQMKNAPYRPASGFTPATSANAMHSGTSANDDVRPASSSPRSSEKREAGRREPERSVSMKRYGLRQVG